MISNPTIASKLFYRVLKSASI